MALSPLFEPTTILRRYILHNASGKMLMSKDGKLVLGYTSTTGAYALPYVFRHVEVAEIPNGQRTYSDRRGTIRETFFSPKEDISDEITINRGLANMSTDVTSMEQALAQADAYDSEMVSTLLSNLSDRTESLVANGTTTLDLTTLNIRGQVGALINEWGDEWGSIDINHERTASYADSGSVVSGTAYSYLRAEVSKRLGYLCFPTIAPGCRLKITLAVSIRSRSYAYTASGTSSSHPVTFSGPIVVKYAPISGDWYALAVDDPLTLSGSWVSQRIAIDPLVISGTTRNYQYFSWSLEVTVPESRQIALYFDFGQLVTQAIFSQILDDDGYTTTNSSGTTTNRIATEALELEVYFTGISLEAIAS